MRKSRGLTQEKFAEMVDLSTPYISNIECGFKMPKLNTFINLANALQCDADLLLFDVLDVNIKQESNIVSKKLLALPPKIQRQILRIVEIMIDEIDQN